MITEEEEAAMPVGQGNHVNRKTGKSVRRENHSESLGSEKELSNPKQKLTEAPGTIMSNRNRKRIAKSDSSESDRAKSCKDCTHTNVYGSGYENSSESSENDPTYDQKCNSRFVGIANCGILRNTKASERQQREYGRLESK